MTPNFHNNNKRRNKNHARDIMRTWIRTLFRIHGQIWMQMLWLYRLYRDCADMTVGIGADIMWTFIWPLVRIFIRILMDMDAGIEMEMTRIGLGIGVDIGVDIKWIFVGIDIEIARIFRWRLRGHWRGYCVDMDTNIMRIFLGILCGYLCGHWCGHCTDICVDIGADIGIEGVFLWILARILIRTLVWILARILRGYCADIVRTFVWILARTLELEGYFCGYWPVY